MPIRESSFRIGAGRYVQGRGYLAKVGEEVRRLGTSPLIVGGKTALSVARARLESGIAACERYEIVTHTGSCNDERATELAALAREKNYDVIVGVGGGVICDFAKLIAHFSGLPVINVPTSSATCAAFTPLSVRYTPDGRTVGTLHLEREVNAVVVDTDVIAAQPVRLFLAGVFDALAKFIEIKQRIDESPAMGLDYAYVMAEHSYATLTASTDKCLADMSRGEVTEELESVIFTAIAATGVISGIARGSNQTALAHKLYETARFLYPDATRPYLHGELVGIGLLLQNHFNGSERDNEALIDLMKKQGMPYRITDVGIEPGEESYRAFFDKISHSSAVNRDSEECLARFGESLKYLWNIK